MVNLDQHLYNNPVTLHKQITYINNNQEQINCTSVNLSVLSFPLHIYNYNPNIYIYIVTYLLSLLITSVGNESSWFDKICSSFTRVESSFSVSWNSRARGKLEQNSTTREKLDSSNKTRQLEKNSTTRGTRQLEKNSTTRG